jgi:CRP/FNR family transcriptional regulator
MGPASVPLSRSAVLASIDLFAPLSPSERDALAAGAHPQSYAPGEDLFQEGEPCRGIHIVSSGAVRIVKTTPAGRQVMLAIQEAPATVAEVPVFDGGPYPATVTAVQPVSAFLIHKEDFLACCRRNPGLSLRFLEVFGHRLRQLVNLVELITFGSVRQRLAAVLLEFSDAAGARRFALPETQEELATRLGTVREVVSRNLGRFQTEGLLRIQRREIEILDPAGLRTEAETEI